MANISKYLENAFLGYTFSGEAFPQPTQWYVALYPQNPTDDPVGAGVNELSGFGYARKSVTFSAPAGSSVENTNTVEFQAVGGTWQTATHAAIFDASVAGNMLWHGVLQDPKTLAPSDKISFSPGDIILSVD